MMRRSAEWSLMVGYNEQKEFHLVIHEYSTCMEQLDLIKRNNANSSEKTFMGIENSAIPGFQKKANFGVFGI